MSAVLSRAAILDSPWPVLPRPGLSAELLSRVRYFTTKVWVPDPVIYPDACWIWQRCLNGTGRGQFGLYDKGNISTTAPRASFILFVGELSDHECACHKCDDPLCVRPSHLFRGTYAENTSDMRAKGRAWYQRSPR